MACSYCGVDGHNVRSCAAGWPGIAARNVGALTRVAPAPVRKIAVPGAPAKILANCSLQKLLSLCSAQNDFLVHLYWPSRNHYFDDNLKRLGRNASWLLVATSGHGVGNSIRATINFLAADQVFAAGYPTAKQERNLHHGVLLRRAAIRQIATSTGYDAADVLVGHPKGFGVHDTADYWRFDIGKYRFGALHALRNSTVVRLATPASELSRRVLIPSQDIIAWW